MSNMVNDHEVMINRWMKDPNFKKAYDKLDDEFALFDAMLEARKKEGLTQEEVARRMKTKKSSISRLESSVSRHSPTIETLKKYAIAVNCKLVIKFEHNYR